MSKGWSLAARIASRIPWRLLAGRDALAVRSMLSTGRVDLYYESDGYTVLAGPPPRSVEAWAHSLARDRRVERLTSRILAGRLDPWTAGLAARHALDHLGRLRVEIDSPGAVVLGRGDGGWFASILAPQHHWLLHRCRPRGVNLRGILGFKQHLDEWDGGPGWVRVQGDLVAHIYSRLEDGVPAWLFHQLSLAERAAEEARRLSLLIDYLLRGNVRIDHVSRAAVEALESTRYARLLADHVRVSVEDGLVVVGVSREAWKLLSERLGIPYNMGAHGGGLDADSLPQLLAAATSYIASGQNIGASVVGGVRVYYAPLLLAASLLEASTGKPRVPPPARVVYRLGRHTVEYQGWLLGGHATVAFEAPCLARGLASTVRLAWSGGCFWLDCASRLLGWRRARLHVVLGKIVVGHPEHGRVELEGGLVFSLSTLNTLRV